VPSRVIKTTIAKVIPLAAGGLLAVSVLAGGPPARAAGTATINGAATFQTITGFGASEGFGQAATVMNAASSVKTQALNYLFNTSGGAGLTILRNEISADSGDTIEPTSPGSPTAAPSYVSLASIGNDQGQLSMAQAIRAAPYNVTNVFADAWSAPPFMKVNNSVDNGGALCGVPSATCSSGDWRQAYANYLKQYAADYSAAGVPLTYIGPENEANFAPSNYDGMTLTPSQTASLLDVLGPTMAGTGTQVECCATEGWDFAQQYAQAIEADSTANADTAVFTSHGYTAAPTSPLSGWSKPAWQTEWSTFEGWDPAWDDGSAASGLTWAQHIFTGLDSSNLSAFLYWWGSGTPSGNGDNESLIQINGSTVTPSGRLWAFANFSDYVRPGAVRIGATAPDGNVTLDAFKNADGSISIVALNASTSADPVSFALTGTGIQNGAVVTPHLTNSTSNVATQATTTVSGGAFSASVPARSLVTYTIPAGQVQPPPPGVTVTNPGAQTSTVGTAASLQIQATDSTAGQTLAYSATGLPAGESISSSTGLISGTPITAGSSQVTVTATDTAGTSGTATFTWTVNPVTTGGACTVTYTTASQWAGGFVAGVAFTSSSALSNWTLRFTFPGDQHITSGWNGTISQSGENVTITNASYNGSVAAGGSASFGFQGTWTSSDAVPTAFTLNGQACTTG
jgi:O-glycosyl hydrolase